jgi:hypothetical protein
VDRAPRRIRRDNLHSRFGSQEVPAVTRSNILYLIIGALLIAVAALGYQLYQDRHPTPPQGVHIDLGPNGLSIQGK